MMLDAFNTFSFDQVVDGAEVVSDETVDTRYKNIGEGQPVFLYVHVNEEFEGDGNLTIELQHRDGDGDTWETAMAVGPLEEGSLYQGADTRVSVPPGTEKELRVRYVKDGTLSNGKVYAGLRWT